MIFIYIFIQLIGIQLNAFYDYNKSIGFFGHTIRWLVRCFFALISALLMTQFDFFKNFTYTLFASVLWWICFDLAYNYLKKLSLLYVGQTATTDKIFKNMPYLQFFVKGLLLLYSICWLVEPSAFQSYDSVVQFCDQLQFHFYNFIKGN
jgi:hypothetical protein